MLDLSSFVCVLLSDELVILCGGYYLLWGWRGEEEKKRRRGRGDTDHHVRSQSSRAGSHVVIKKGLGEIHEGQQHPRTNQMDAYAGVLAPRLAGVAGVNEQSGRAGGRRGVRHAVFELESTKYPRPRDCGPSHQRMRGLGYLCASSMRGYSLEVPRAMQNSPTSSYCAVGSGTYQQARSPGRAREKPGKRGVLPHIGGRSSAELHLCRVVTLEHHGSPTENFLMGY